MREYGKGENTEKEKYGYEHGIGLTGNGACHGDKML